jgi:hypothetical protein
MEYGICVCRYRDIMTGKVTEEVTVRSSCWLQSSVVKLGRSVREVVRVHEVTESTFWLRTKPAITGIIARARFEACKDVLWL